jgi:hypothetical protein
MGREESSHDLHNQSNAVGRENPMAFFFISARWEAKQQKN